MKKRKIENSRVSMSNEQKNKYWEAVDLLFPKHRMGGQWHKMHKDSPGSYCSDDEPNGSGNFGCKRCDVIVDLERRKKKIWPRSEKMIDELIEELEREGCSCDVMAGWACGIHETIRKLRKMIDEKGLNNELVERLKIFLNADNLSEQAEVDLLTETINRLTESPAEQKC